MRTWRYLIGIGISATDRPDAGEVADAPRPACVDRRSRDRQWGTPADDELLGMALDARGDLIIAGFEGGVDGVTNIEPDGDAVGVVAAWSADGERWRTTYDTPATDVIEDVAIDPISGAIVMVGRTSGAFPGFVNQGQLDLILGELDREGHPRSLVQVGDERPQHPARLSLGPDGAVGVGGWDDTYIPSNYVAARENGFVARFDRSGPRQVWTHYVDPVRANAINDAAIGSDGAVYACGRARDGIYVEKRAPDATLIWRRLLSDVPVDAANAMALTPDALYVTGATVRRLGEASFGQQDAFVAKLDLATGAVAWIAQAGGASSDYPTAIALGDDGRVTIAGISLGAAFEGATYEGSLDVFAMQIDRHGIVRAAWQRGTPAADVATDVVIDSCGHVLVGGWTRGDLIAGAHAARTDMFVLDLATE